MHEAIALLQGASGYAADHDLAFAQMRAANNLGHLLAYDDPAAALEACRTGLEQANRLGEVRFIASFAWAVAAYLERDGRCDEGRAMRDEVRDRLELPRGSELWYEMTDLTCRVELGDATAIEPAYDAVCRSRDDTNPQSQVSVPVSKAKLDLLTGRFETAFDEAMSPDHLFPEHLSVATVAAALLGDVERLEIVAGAVAESPARGRMMGSIEATISGAIAALRGRSVEAVEGFSRALAFRYLRLDRATLQALFATLVGRGVPEARDASDAAFEVLADAGAAAYLDLYAAGMPPADERRAGGHGGAPS
jgi:hypothetical protein